MQRVALASRIRDIARIRGNFRLRSGRVSDTYFDKYLFESDPVILRAIAEHMRDLIPSGTQVLCGLEMGGIPVVTMLSQVSGLPAAFIRKERKEYGTEKYAEGPPLAGMAIVLVEDVISTGGAVRGAAALLRSDGIGVSQCLCVIDRMTGGREALAEAGIELRPLLTMQEIEGAP